MTKNFRRFYILPTLVLLGLIILSNFSGYQMQMPAGFPLKAALLLTPIGMLINALPLEGKSFLKYLWAPAIRDGHSIWNSNELLFIILFIALMAFLSMSHVKRSSKKEACE